MMWLIFSVSSPCERILCAKIAFINTIVKIHQFKKQREAGNQILSDKHSIKMVVFKNAYYKCAGRHFDDVINQPIRGSQGDELV